MQRRENWERREYFTSNVHKRKKKEWKSSDYTKCSPWVANKNLQTKIQETTCEKP